MGEGFDFTTDEVLEWEIEAIVAAVDSGALEVSRHARIEAFLDGLTVEDVFDAIAFYDESSKDLPGNILGRAPGINFERLLDSRTRVTAKVGWSRKTGYYIVVTVVASRGGRR